jgi:heme-degrading monooxygenase HmoA
VSTFASLEVLPAMIVLLFSTVPRNDEVREQHDEMTRAMRTLAEGLPGFLGWEEYAQADGGTFGVLRFEDEAVLAAWRDHPDHMEVHRRGVDDVYASYRVEVCELVREASFSWSGV